MILHIPRVLKVDSVKLYISVLDHVRGFIFSSTLLYISGLEQAMVLMQDKYVLLGVIYTQFIDILILE